MAQKPFLQIKNSKNMIKYVVFGETLSNVNLFYSTKLNEKANLINAKFSPNSKTD